MKIKRVNKRNKLDLDKKRRITLAEFFKKLSDEFMKDPGSFIVFSLIASLLCSALYLILFWSLLLQGANDNIFFYIPIQYLLVRISIIFPIIALIILVVPALSSDLNFSNLSLKIVVMLTKIMAAVIFIFSFIVTFLLLCYFPLKIFLLFSFLKYSRVVGLVIKMPNRYQISGFIYLMCAVFLIAYIDAKAVANGSRGPYTIDAISQKDNRFLYLKNREPYTIDTISQKDNRFFYVEKIGGRDFLYNINSKKIVIKEDPHAVDHSETMIDLLMGNLDR